MKFREKIAKAFRLRTYTHSKVFQAASGNPEKLQQERQEDERRRLVQTAKKRHADLVEKLKREIDQEELKKVVALGEIKDQADIFWTKYLDVDKWLAVNIRHAEELDLLERPVADVLDLGCGAGYFLLVCRALGARTLGVDVDWDQVLNRMIGLFKLARITLTIEPQVKLPDFGRKFDLITGFMICFNFPTMETHWSVADWNFFLNDLSNYLKPDGRVLLSLNKQADGEHYTEAIKQYFLSRGAKIKGKRVLFDHGVLQRSPAQATALTAA